MKKQLSMIDYNKAVCEILSATTILLDKNGDPIKDDWGGTIYVPLPPQEMLKNLLALNKSVTIVTFNKDKKT